MKTLEQVLENISYPDSDHMNEMQLKRDIEKEMQGWTIETWDMDEYGTELTKSVADTIISEIQDGKKEIQYEEFCTDNLDAYFAILATK